MRTKKISSSRQFSFQNLPHPLIAFFATTVMLVLYFAASGYTPFGSDTFLFSDLETQYAPYLMGLKTHFSEGGALSYSFHNGLGKNVMGMFAYYLSSPINLLIWLFPVSMVSHAVLLIVAIKLSLAAAFMTYYLERRSNTKNLSSIFFGMLYVFSTYAIIYMMNLMWLDGFLLLPLILAGIERYLKNRNKWVFLVIVFTVLFISGYYIAYMIGIFSFLYLFGRLVELRFFDSDRKKEVIQYVLRFLGSAGLAAGLSMWLIIPAGLDTLRNPDYTGLPFVHEMVFLPLDILDQFFVGAFDNLMTNKPFLYAGLITIILVILFFLHPQISKRRKAVACAALVFFFLSFIYTGLERFWHLFDEPNWFRHRQSFIAVFILISIAYNAFLRIHELTKKQFIQCGLIMISTLIFVASFGELSYSSERFFTNLFFLVVILLLLGGSTVASWPEAIAGLRKIAVPVLITVIVVEVVFVNSFYTRAEAGLGSHYTQYVFEEHYNRMRVLTDYAKAYKKEDGNSFFRMDVDRRARVLSNYSAGHYLDYPAVSVFQSGSNKHVNRFLKQLGFRVNFNYFAARHSYNSMPTDAFLGVAFVMTSESQTAGYNWLLSSGDEILTYNLFHNESAFPIIFPVQTHAGTFDYYQLERNEQDKNYFVFQNEWLQSLFSSLEGEDIFYPAAVEGPWLNNAIMSESMFRENKMHRLGYDRIGLEPHEGIRDIESKFVRLSSNDRILIEYEIKIESDHPLYLCIPTWDHSFDAMLLINEQEVFYLSGSSFTEIIELGVFEPGDTVTVRIEPSIEIDVVGFIDLFAYYCNMDLFKDLIEQTEVFSAARDIDVLNGYVQATLTLKEDALVLTTIPYEQGWTLRVNGDETEIIPYQNAFISFPLDAGDYEVELSFRAPGLRLGMVISIISLIIFVAIILIKFYYRGKNDRQTKGHS